MRNDVRYSVGMRNQTFGRELDRYAWAEILFGATDRFRQFGFGADAGVIGGRPYSFLSARGSWRIGPRLTAAFASNLLALNGGTQQHVATANGILGRHESLGGRCIVRDGQIGGFLSYRRAGGAGTEWYAVLGEPNATRFRRVLQIKMVFSR